MILTALLQNAHAGTEESKIGEFGDRVRALGYEWFECTIGQEGALLYDAKHAGAPRPPAGSASVPGAISDDSV